MNKLFVGCLCLGIVLTGCGASGAAAPDEDEPVYRGKTLPEWMAALKSSDKQTRLEAAALLTHLGPKAKTAIPALKEATNDPDQGVQGQAFSALRFMGPEVLPFLFDALLSKDTNRTAMALSSFSDRGHEAVPGLLKLLAGDDVRGRRAAAQALGVLNSRKGLIPALRQALRDQDGIVRVSAAASLRRVSGDSQASLPVLVEALKDKDAEVRWHAADSLPDFGPAAATAIPILEETVKDAAARVRVRAAWALWEIDPERQGPKALSLLMETVRDKDDNVCREALFALSQLTYQHKDEMKATVPAVIEVVKNRKQHRPKTVVQAIWNLIQLGPEARAALPVLADAVKNNEPAVAEQAARYLPVIAPKDPAVVPALLEAMKHKDGQVRAHAARAFGRLGAQAEPAVPALLQALKDPNYSDLRAAAAWTLGELGAVATPSVVPALVDALEDKHPYVRLGAAKALIRLDPAEAKAAIPALIRSLDDRDSGHHYTAIDTLRTVGPDALGGLAAALKDKSAQVRSAAAYGLGDFGPAARSAVPALQEALKDGDARVRVLAATALGRLNPRAEGILPLLTEGLTARDMNVRQRAIETVGQLGPAAQPAVPSLIRVLKAKDDDPWRALASRALGQIGPTAEAAVPALTEALQDPQSDLRGAAAEALGKIGPKDEATIAALFGMVKEPEGRNLHYAIEALQRCGARAVPHLLKALKDEDPDVRSLFMSIQIPVAGVDRSDVKEALRWALQDPEPRVRFGAAHRLVIIDREPGSTEAIQEVLPVVKAGLQDADAGVRAGAAGLVSQMAERGMGRGSADLRPLIMEALKDKNAQVRVQASRSLHTLVVMQPLPKELLPVLVELLKDKDSSVRQEAAMVMGRFGPQAKAALPVLLEMLKSKDDTLHNMAISALVAIGKDDQTVVAALVQSFQNTSDSNRRANLANSLAGFGEEAKEAVPALVAALKDENTHLREAAIRALSRIDPENKLLVPVLTEVLGKQDESPYFNRYQTAEVLHRLGPDAVESLAKLLKDANPQRRVGAALALGSLGKSAGGAAAALRKALNDETPRVRLRAAEALWLASGEAQAAAPVLIEALKGKDLQIGRQAVVILGQMGPAAKDAVPALIEALKAADEQLPAGAAQALGRIGPEAVVAVPALVDVLKEGGDSWARYSAAEALGSFGPDAKDAIPLLIQMLKDSSPRFRQAAAGALGRIATAKEAGPALVEALRETNPGYEDLSIRHTLAEALRKIGPHVSGDVGKLLKDKRAEVRGHAAGILAGFGPQAKSELPTLLQAVMDEDEEVAVQAASAVWQIDRRKDGLPALRRGLKAKPAAVRRQAAQTLGLMGQDAKEAVIDLMAAAVGDPAQLVRQAALIALQNIDPEAADRAKIQ